METLKLVLSMSWPTLVIFFTQNSLLWTYCLHVIHFLVEHFTRSFDTQSLNKSVNSLGFAHQSRWTLDP